ncbi:hypothetical protein BGV49_22035 [Burkholderia ubonensis]|nr:hypothetical protein BGV49_22035 [Burkholderia ubonensis]
MRAFAKNIASDARPWFSRVPELTDFLAEPNYERFRTMMCEVRNGFDMIKVPFLAVKMANVPGLSQSMGSWRIESDLFYVQVVTQARSVGTELSVGIDTPYKVELQEPRTRNYGTLLPHQQAIGQYNYEDFLEGHNFAVDRVLTPGYETQFERNALANGQTVVRGASGSTNLMVHLNRHIASKLSDFSQAQAYLNTLAFLVFDGGHSVNDSLAVYHALAAPEEQRSHVLESYTANYHDIPSMLAGQEGGAILRALNEAFDKTVTLHRQLQQPAKAPTLPPENVVAPQPGSEQDQDGAEARTQQLAKPLNQIARKLQRIAADAETRSPLEQLEAMSQKNRYGQFDLNQQVLGRMNYASSDWERQLGVELNISYLRLLQALVQDAGPLVAEKAARLLRSPDNGKLTFAKLAGYYRSVLEHGLHHPELIDALKVLLDRIGQQARPSTIAKLTAKVQKQLEQVLQSGAAPTRQAAGFAEIQQRLESIRSRCMELAGRQAADEARQQAHDQQQNQRATELQQILTQHGLVVPSYMRDSLDDSHVALARTIQADFERLNGLLRESSRSSLEASLNYLRSLENGYSDSISAKQAELEQPHTQTDRSGKSALNQALNAAKKALSAVQSEAVRLSKRSGRELDAGICELDRDARNRLLGQFLDAGIYLENPAEEKAALQRCLQSDAAQRIVSKAVDDSKDFLGQVIKDKAIELASKRLVEHVMDDNFFGEKMEKIKQSFDNQGTALVEASWTTASTPTLAQAQAEAGSEVRWQVMEATQSQVNQQAKAVAEELAHRQAQASAREQADRAARKQAAQAARQEAVYAAREQAEHSAREQAAQAARQEAVYAAREQAEHSAREQAAQAARQEAVGAAREQALREAERNARIEAEAMAARLAQEQAQAEARASAERAVRAEVEKASAERLSEALLARYNAFNEERETEAFFAQFDAFNTKPIEDRFERHLNGDPRPIVCDYPLVPIEEPGQSVGRRQISSAT